MIRTVPHAKNILEKGYPEVGCEGGEEGCVIMNILGETVPGRGGRGEKGHPWLLVMMAG